MIPLDNYKYFKGNPKNIPTNAHKDVYELNCSQLNNIVIPETLVNLRILRCNYTNHYIIHNEQSKSLIIPKTLTKISILK